MGLLDASSEEPKSKLRRYVITGIVFALLMALAGWYFLRFRTEKKTVATFLDTLAAENLEAAYRIWKPQGTYSYQDFLDDWGPKGLYGPVKSYRIVMAERPKGGSGVIVVVEVSPFTPFPGDSEAEKNRRMKEVRIWVESRDLSLSYPP